MRDHAAGSTKQVPPKPPSDTVVTNGPRPSALTGVRSQSAQSPQLGRKRPSPANPPPTAQVLLKAAIRRSSTTSNHPSTISGVQADSSVVRPGSSDGDVDGAVAVRVAPFRGPTDAGCGFGNRCPRQLDRRR